MFVKERAVTIFSRRSLLAGAAVLLAAAPRPLPAADATAGKRIALKGYDPVSYFTKGQPAKGSEEFVAAFDGATYWFSNAEHRALFVADPDKYAPQFAGFCAIMVSRGQKYEADPEHWAIADGKLYVFGAKEAVPMFRDGTAAHIAQANHRWPQVRATP
jgi:YHS domain-containing protein